MSSIVFSLLNEVRGSTNKPTATSTSSLKQRTYSTTASTNSLLCSKVSVAATTTKRTQLELIESATTHSTRHFSLNVQIELVSPLCRPSTLPAKPLPPAPPTTLIKKHGRLSEAAYNSLSIGDLRIQARRRCLQLQDDTKHYLIKVLMLFDEEYDQLFTRIGNPVECEAYARAAVKHHNAEISTEIAEKRRARAKFDREQKLIKAKEALASAEKLKVATKELKPSISVRNDAEKHVAKSIEVEVVDAPRHQKAQKTLESKSCLFTDSGYSTGSSITTPTPTPPPKVSPSIAEEPKGRKRTLPDDINDASKPLKKAKLPTTEQAMPQVVTKTQQRRIATPKTQSSRSTELNKQPSKGDAKPMSKKTISVSTKKESQSTQEEEEEAPVRGVAQPTSRKKPAEPKKTLGKRKVRAEESDPEDDFIVEDVQARPKKSSNRGVSKFFAGMR
ncbi:hypothetical protein T440DRAFT_526862 [Plenodomus tracheiphilus IPT5]|uniref:Uncharacterized protein n=1 Tax=Plenodomus tracheiphilus IPT5 TaxID=1408161 RepID=A0A6A7BC32_9PLEO|nr:hypothetical protein T440DRAFT_526862 [Plenodomus tracheiphilus IPT5]